MTQTGTPGEEVFSSSVPTTLLHTASRTVTAAEYLLTAEGEEVRVLGDDGLHNTSFVKVGQLGISFIWSHEAVHSQGPSSL